MMQRVHAVEEDPIWGSLLQTARAARRPRAIGRHVEVGAVAAALRTPAGNIHVGICLDTACSLGFCAERAALAAMLTAGEDRPTHLLALGPDGALLPPCGACRELLLQLGAGDALMLLGDPPHLIPLRDLLPQWWAATETYPGHD